jgi:hypothetical protein
MTTSQLFYARVASLVTMRPRLQWLLMHQRTVLDHNTLWPDARTGQFARIVDGLVSPVVRSGRPLEAVCFQFGAEHYLIVVHRDFSLCVILPNAGEVIDEIASAALSMLEECEVDIRYAAGLHPKPEIPPAYSLERPFAAEAESDHEPAWNAFHTHLIEVIGKLLPRPQAERLIARELQARNIAGIPVAADFERIGRDVVAHIPHRTKQAVLLAEVLHFLKP